MDRKTDAQLIRETFSLNSRSFVFVSPNIAHRIFKYLIEVVNTKLDQYVIYCNRTEGEYKMWSDTGQMIYSGYFINGCAEGERKQWYYNGLLKSQTYYVNGKVEGEYKQWYDIAQSMVS